MNFISGAISGAADAVGGAADAVSSAVKGGAFGIAAKIAEMEVKDQTGKEIEIDYEDVDDDNMEWLIKTGLNSLCCDGTWSFIEDSSYNKRKLDKWHERDVTKIIMTVERNPEEHSGWKICDVKWDDSAVGPSTITISWYPRALRWESSRTWKEPGSKCWWDISDELVFGMQLYQLPGKCFYKSDWVEDFEDYDPDAFFSFSKKSFRRWLQFRHWTMMWFARAMPGWNYQWTTKPPSLPDGSLFNLDAILSMPSMPDVKMPKINFPSLPDVEMPDVSLPDVSMPDISLPDAPSLSMPSLSAPDLSAPSIPSLPDKKLRPKNPWAAHGIIEINKDLYVEAGSGATFTLSNAKVTGFLEDGNGYIDTEEEEGQKFKLGVTDHEQAESWEETLLAVGCQKGEKGGCCVVA